MNRDLGWKARIITTVRLVWAFPFWLSAIILAGGTLIMLRIAGGSYRYSADELAKEFGFVAVDNAVYALAGACYEKAWEWASWLRGWVIR